MAKARKFVAYRRLERPYTRKSKYRKKSFIRASPHSRVVRYDMGDPNGNYDYVVQLIAKNDLQIRHNAIESARVTSNRVMEKKAGKNQYALKIRIYPHHILRENALASGAGADRLSTGMKMSFGKPVGVAAQVHIGKEIIEVKCQKQHLDLARLAMKRASHKLPCKYSIVVEPIAKKVEKPIKKSIAKKVVEEQPKEKPVSKESQPVEETISEETTSVEEPIEESEKNK